LRAAEGIYAELRRMAHMPGDSKGCEKDAGRKYPYWGRPPTLPRQLTLGISLSHSLFMQRERSPGANHVCATIARSRARREETTASSVTNLPGHFHENPVRPSF
jgi:hypothetical protein